MIRAFRSEMRKLLSVRSTYAISLIFLLLSAFFSFYVHGYRDAGAQARMLNSLSPIDQAQSSLFVAGSITQIATVVSIAGGLIALLLLAHEYRYNTMVYTLTASNSRSKVLAAKILAILAYVLVYAAIATAISLALVWAGAALAGHSLPHQDINFLTFFGKCVFFAEAYSLAGLLFIAIIRNQIGAIAALLILPNTVEGLLSLLLKNHSTYMPFMALSQVIQPPVINIAGLPPAPPSPMGELTPVRGALIFLCYLVVGYVVAWILFLKRDAT